MRRWCFLIGRTQPCFYSLVLRLHEMENKEEGGRGRRKRAMCGGDPWIKKLICHKQVLLEKHQHHAYRQECGRVTCVTLRSPSQPMSCPQTEAATPDEPAEHLFLHGGSMAEICCIIVEKLEQLVVQMESVDMVDLPLLQPVCLFWTRPRFQALKWGQRRGTVHPGVTICSIKPL